MAERICYVYGVVAPTFDVSDAPEGLDDSAVSLEREGPVAALLSSLDASAYAENVLEARTADIEWLAPRATAHDRVLTWASDRAPVAPFPLLSLFRDSSGVRAMLRDRHEELEHALARSATGREYQLRVFRLDARVAEHLRALSPRIAELEDAAERARPGQKYLLERKLTDERRMELRRVGAEVAQEVHDALRAAANDTVMDSLPRSGPDGDAGTAVLNAAYLVSDARLDDFRAVLTRLIERWEPEGFRFEFTGPWPVYHFVREGTDGE